MKALAPEVKRDFFGRVIEARPLQELDANSGERRKRRASAAASGERGHNSRFDVGGIEGVNRREDLG